MKYRTNVHRVALTAAAILALCCATGCSLKHGIELDPDITISSDNTKTPKGQNIIIPNAQPQFAPAPPKP